MAAMATESATGSARASRVTTENAVGHAEVTATRERSARGTDLMKSMMTV